MTARGRIEMKKVLVPVAGLFLISAALAQSQPQQTFGTQSQDNQSTTLYRVTMVARTTKAINYGHLSGATRIDFRGTPLLPQAKGQARVESRRGAVKVQAQFEKMQPAAQFGPEYLTYVLWAIDPVGRATNLGEALLEGGKSKVDASAELQSFALIVTAEPYFAVMQPSDVVVMENIVRPDTAGKIEEIDAKFDLLQRGQYSNISSESQAGRIDPRVPLGLYEARNALKIARAAGADRYASDTFAKAEQLLRQGETFHAHKAEKKQVEMMAREAVQTAEDARALTMKRRDDERQAMERQAAADREARAKAETEEATKRTAEAVAARAAAERAKLEAELAAERAARERAEVEAARAALVAQQQALQNEAANARQAADSESRQRVAAESARAAAESQQRTALAEAERSRQAAEQSERFRQQAEAEKTELRSRLLNQLSSILQTRDSVRGLIVNMSDVLFDSGRYTLKPGAREKLAKISGIVLAYPGLNLQIEGHTDNVGGEDFNQQLSERRAASVRDFLVQQGVSAASITARGLGKTQPVASNESAEGRQQNRRVELVVTGEAIGTATVASTKNLTQ
ncbi:MAG: flagellar motor protein MotB [Acidobacteria bacterium]|nr:MAG: flagellar motor protein MotB [Acidobacteriota bacterium]